MTVRAKFVCRSVTDFGSKVNVEMHAVYSGSPENKAFWEATPAGNLTLSTVNKDSAERFKPGQEYYIDISPAQ